MEVILYPLSRYTYNIKEAKIERYNPRDRRLDRMKENYIRDGMRRSVQAVVVVHVHNHPHILLLKRSFDKFCYYKLPGGCLKPGENEFEGLKRKLTSKLGATTPAFVPDWQIGELVAIWWRPSVDSFNTYPYCPPHITKPKECEKLFLVPLSDREYFEVPRPWDLVAVPLLELNENAQRYGPVISSIPQQLSRFQFTMDNGT